VTVTEGFDTCYGGSGWVFPASSAPVASAAPGTGIRRGGKPWDQAPGAFGAVPASTIQVNITASGSGPQAIVLDGIKIRVIRRQPALRGTVVNFAPRICAPATLQIGTVDLDTSPPTLTPAQVPSPSASGQGGERTAPLTFPYTISQSDPELLVLTVTTQHCDCTWTAELDWTEGSKVGHSIIEDNGHPFQTTASSGLPTVIWGQNENNDWIRCGQAQSCM
jgi:hypothetical protein